MNLVMQPPTRVGVVQEWTTFFNYEGMIERYPHIDCGLYTFHRYFREKGVKIIFLLQYKTISTTCKD